MAKILIVDDAEALVAMLSEILIKEGFEVDAVFSKKEMVFYLLSSTPDLFLLDVRLSGDDGRKICRDLKGNSLYKNIPVILLSGSRELLDSYEDFNADAVIEKPFDMHHILEKIKSLLQPVQ